MKSIDARSPIDPPVKCGARSSRTGKPCQKWAVRGATVCASHGGRAPQVMAAARRRLAMGEAIAELDRLGRVVDVDPAEAMLDMVRESASNVVVLRRLVQQLGASVGPGVGAIEGENGIEEGPWIDDIDRSELGVTIAGRVDPGNWKAAPHVFVVMYDAERERLVRFSKMCRDAGVEEHRVQLAEKMAVQLAEVLAVGVAGILAAVRRLLDQGSLTSSALAELERAEVPRLIRQAIEARVLGEGAA